MATLKIQNLSKQYSKDKWGLQNFSITLKPGILGLLGPNGAGKSTLMRMLATITKPTEGEILWDGENIRNNPDRVRSVLGYLPQDFGVYPNLNAVEFLQYLAAMKGLKPKAAKRKISELLELVNLTHALKQPLGAYSGGMKQRVGIAQALLNDPELLIVDEPTVGLDPQERVRFRNLIADLSGSRIVILSTHIVSDVESTATDIALINQGRLIQHTLPENLLKSIEGQVWESTVSSLEYAEIKQSMLVSGATRRSDGMHVRIVHSQQPLESAVQIQPNLEDAYLSLTQANGRG
jgi:ABC-type multidrug transport system ATPase subunit